ncbi:MAG: Gfo/Idh/MocA family oxidoreductase [Ferruginibacter sp.]
MKQIDWGIIGCGDVTEIKSGPAFSKINNSALVAVMRRDASKAKDYAQRHQVAKWYNDAAALINDAAVNAIYIATPPSSHKELTLMALAAGKPVYVEKPMSVDALSAEEMASFARQKNVKLSVAHYRREQPKFKKILSFLQDKVIGDIKLVQLSYYRRPLTREELAEPKTAWRINAEISGGGLFHDIAPHQLDLMLYFFGEASEVSGKADNKLNSYNVADLVTGKIIFKSGIAFNGIWNFSVSQLAEKDEIEIIGTKGKIIFSAFVSNTITVITDVGTEVFSFADLQHVQQPMIQKVVQYFLDESENPCSGGDGVTVLKWIDAFTKLPGSF